MAGSCSRQKEQCESEGPNVRAPGLRGPRAQAAEGGGQSLWAVGAEPQGPDLIGAAGSHEGEGTQLDLSLGKKKPLHGRGKSIQRSQTSPRSLGGRGVTGVHVRNLLRPGVGCVGVCRAG